MQTLMKLIHLSLLVLAAGCVPSLHPLYTDKDVVFDPALLGVWTPDKDSNESWTFTTDDEKSYKLVYNDKDGDSGEFLVHLVKVEGAQFLDLYPVDPKLTENDFYKVHLVKAHTFLLVSQIKPTLRFTPLNLDWLKKFLETNPTAIQHEKVDDRIVLTAQPKDLQDFLLAHLKTKDAFSELTDLERKCPTCLTNLIAVPILIGIPTKEMEQELKLGRALLGGCSGDPSKPEKALVCLKCRKWKTETMKYWQDLPKNFGLEPEKSKESQPPYKTVEPTPPAR